MTKAQQQSVKPAEPQQQPVKPAEPQQPGTPSPSNAQKRRTVESVKTHTPPSNPSLEPEQGQVAEELSPTMAWLKDASFANSDEEPVSQERLDRAEIIGVGTHIFACLCAQKLKVQHEKAS